MGTRADFYVGRGPNAEWLGSIAWDGYPDGIDDSVLKAASEGAYRAAVTTFLADREDASLPSDGWPWPWDDSGTTDYAYAFENCAVVASCFGARWHDPNAERTEEEEDADDKFPATFPNMSDRKRRPIFGKHSGVIVVGS